MSFSLDLQKFVEKAKDNADQLVGEVVDAIAFKIDERSPVGNPKLWKSPPPKGYVGGRFRGNWQLGVDTIPGGTLDRIDPSGDTTRAQIRAAIPDQAAGHVYYLVNNLPYGHALEFGNHSTQAPRGIVGRTVIEFQQIINEKVESLQ